MSRWQPDAQGRLAQAALELYVERGYEQTTVAEIANRAGLTERTFFRYFADKREVLFSGSSALQELLVRTVTDAPKSMRPIDAVAVGVQAMAGRLQERRDHSMRRQAAIAANVELRERELIKLASLATALAAALRARGVTDLAANLTAEAGIAVFKIAFERWIDAANERDFADLIRESLAELKAVTAQGRNGLDGYPAHRREPAHQEHDSKGSHQTGEPSCAKGGEEVADVVPRVGHRRQTAPMTSTLTWAARKAARPIKLHRRYTRPNHMP